MKQRYCHPFLNFGFKKLLGDDFALMQHVLLPLIILISLLATSCQDYAQPERLRRFMAAQKNIVQNTATKKLTAPSDTTAADTVPLITHRVVLRTSLGEMIIGLYGKDAPQTVENFVKLAEKKFFRGILVHRVARNFVVQTGDPKTKDKRKKDEWGTGGESAFGEPFPDEIFLDAPSTKAGYKHGTIAMASRSPDANTSQFFICLRDLPELPQRFTIFGKVLDGLDVLDAIGKAEIIPQLNENDGRPVKAIVIKSVVVAKIRPMTQK